MQPLNTRDDVVTEARKWIGTKWHHQGRSTAGIDCAGLLVRVMGDLNIPVEDRKGYKRVPDKLDFLDHIRKQTEHATEPKPGNIAIFRQTNFPCHVGFFANDAAGNITLIHAYLTAGKVIEELFIHEWPRLLVEIRQIKDIVD